MTCHNENDRSCHLDSETVEMKDFPPVTDCDHGHRSSTDMITAISATVHCLVGCSIGEFIGLFIGVSLGFPIIGIIVLDTTLAFISGFLLTLIPIMKRRKIGLKAAFKIIWLGEVVSISVMEFTMNLVDYHAGGMSTGSVFHLGFWLGFLVSLPAGFIAAYPVNYWMIRRNLKKCH